MNVAVVTCSWQRPQLLALCKEYIGRQTVKPDTVILREENMPPFANLQAALADVPPRHHVIVMEDDDWYDPQHIAVMLDPLQDGKKLAAPYWTRRINLPARRYNVKHSPTPGPGMTGIHCRYIKRYAELLSHPDGDRRAWLECGLVPDLTSTVVGIKGVGYGLPGRAGKTTKHHPKSGIVARWTPDPDLRRLRDWIGDDVKNYIALLQS